jgi:hypothetical protein
MDYKEKYDEYIERIKPVDDEVVPIDGENTEQKKKPKPKYNEIFIISKKK